MKTLKTKALSQILCQKNQPLLQNSFFIPYYKTKCTENRIKNSNYELLKIGCKI